MPENKIMGVHSQPSGFSPFSAVHLVLPAFPENLGSGSATTPRHLLHGAVPQAANSTRTSRT